MHSFTSINTRVHVHTCKWAHEGSQHICNSANKQTHTHIYIHTYICIYIYISYMHSFTSKSTHMHVHTCKWAQEGSHHICNSANKRAACVLPMFCAAVTNICTCVCVCVYIHMTTAKYEHVKHSMYVCKLNIGSIPASRKVYICVCVCVCVYIYIYI